MLSEYWPLLKMGHLPKLGMHWTQFRFGLHCMIFRIPMEYYDLCPISCIYYSWDAFLYPHSCSHLKKNSYFMQWWYDLHEDCPSLLIMLIAVVHFFFVRTRSILGTLKEDIFPYCACNCWDKVTFLILNDFLF